MANEVLMTISQDEREWAYQTSRYKYIVDTQSQMVEAKREGLAEGLAIGEAKGEAKRSAEVARNMKTEGLPAALIAKMTGLSVSDIEKL